MSAGFRGLLELLGLWPSKPSVAPPVVIESGCIELAIIGARISVAIAAPMIAISVRQAAIGIEVFVCD